MLIQIYACSIYGKACQPTSCRTTCPMYDVTTQYGRKACGNRKNELLGVGWNPRLLCEYKFEAYTPQQKHGWATASGCNVACFVCATTERSELYLNTCSIGNNIP